MTLTKGTDNTAKSREAKIQQYAPLVKYVIGRLAIGIPAILDYEDIRSFGTIGLIEALDRFDESKGVKFESYAINRIRGAIIDALRQLDHLPRSVRSKAKQMVAANLQLRAAKGREPTDAEVAEAMGLTLAQYRKTIVDCSWITVSLDGLLERDDNNDSGGPSELPADPNEEDFTAQLEKKETLDELTRAVKALPDRELLIVSLYYRDEVTMREIAEVLEISESRVCQLHARALLRLRGSLWRERAA